MNYHRKRIGAFADYVLNAAIPGAHYDWTYDNMLNDWYTTKAIDAIEAMEAY